MPCRIALPPPLRWTHISALAAFLLLVAVTSAQEQPWGDSQLPFAADTLPPAGSPLQDFESLETQLAFPATSISFGWLAPGGLEGFGGADFDVQRSWLLPVGYFAEPVVITPGFGMHFWSGPGVLDLPPRVYDLYLDLSWRFLSRDWWGIAGGITPGFYGDFERIDGDAFQLTGWLLGDWSVNDHWTVLGGIAYVRQTTSNLLPVGGVVWQPHDDLRVELVVPRPRVARCLRREGDRETWMYVSGVFGGGAWAVDDGSENVLVQYSDFRLVLGSQWLRSNGRSLVAELGSRFHATFP